MSAPGRHDRMLLIWGKDYGSAEPVDGLTLGPDWKTLPPEAYAGGKTFSIQYGWLIERPGCFVGDFYDFRPVLPISESLWDMIRSLWVCEVSSLNWRAIPGVYKSQGSDLVWVINREPWPGWHYVRHQPYKATIIYAAAPLNLLLPIWYWLKDWRRLFYRAGFIDAGEGQDFREARWTWNPVATHRRRRELFNRVLSREVRWSDYLARIDEVRQRMGR